MVIHTFRKVFHVGKLRPELKGEQGPSQEGWGLSVSEHPEAWRRIARLGDSPTWTLTRAGNQFLSWLALSTAERQEVFTWGEAQGLVHLKPVWEVRWFDEEARESVAFTFENEQDALDELDDGRELVQQQGWIAASRLTAMSQYADSKLPIAMVPDMLAIAYAQAHGLDGVFWNERLDVYGLSAPRAVILCNQLPAWSMTKVPS